MIVFTNDVRAYKKTLYNLPTQAKGARRHIVIQVIEIKITNHLIIQNPTDQPCGAIRATIRLPNSPSQANETFLVFFDSWRLAFPFP